MFEVAIVGGGLPGIYVAKWLLKLGYSSKEICIIEPHYSVFMSDPNLSEIFGLRNKRQQKFFENMHKRLKPREIVDVPNAYAVISWTDSVVAKKVIIASRVDMTSDLMNAIKLRFTARVRDGGEPCVAQDMRWVEEIYIAGLTRPLHKIRSEWHWLEQATWYMESAFRYGNVKRACRRLIREFC